MVELDKILEGMGRLSWRQRIQVLLMLIPSALVAAHMGAMVFLGADVDKRCLIPNENQLMVKCNRTWTEEQEKISVPWDPIKKELSSCKRYNLSSLRDAENCSFWWPEDKSSFNNSISIRSSPETVACTSWKYNNSVFTSTVVTEFDLVCSNADQRYTSQSIFMIGVTLGCVFWGQISDRFGRKVSFEVSAVTGTLLAGAAYFSPSYSVFVLLRSLSGFCLFSVFTTAFVLATEVVAPKNRVRIGQTCQAFFALGFCLLALYGKLIRDWRTLQLTLTLQGVLLIPYHWLVCESPRWLISTRRYQEANVTIQKFLKSAKSKKDIKEVRLLEQIVEKKTENKDDGEIVKEEKSKYSAVDLIRTPNMRSKTIKLCYSWFVCSCVYYGLTLNSADLGGDPFINLFVSGFVEIPAVYLCIPMLERWGRRPSLSFTLILAGCSCMMMFVVPKELLWLKITLSMIGKFSVSAAFGTAYIYAAELYPTPIRNVGIGICSGSARVGAVLSSCIAMLTNVAKPLPYVVFGIMSMIGGVVALLLPEVLGIRLPETIEEGEAFGLDQMSPFKAMYQKACCYKNNHSNPTNRDQPQAEYTMVVNQRDQTIDTNKV